MSGICFEAIQFGVGDENRVKMKQNQPDVNLCWSWVMGTWGSLYYYFYFCVEIIHTHTYIYICSLYIYLYLTVWANREVLYTHTHTHTHTHMYFIIYIYTHTYIYVLFIHIKKLSEPPGKSYIYTHTHIFTEAGERYMSVACRILVPWWRIKSMPPEVEVWSLNH